MDKETLSHYGWIVILVLILAVMLALASPFGSFIAGAIKSTTAGLFNVNQAALGSAGIDVNDVVFNQCEHEYTTDVVVDCNTTGTINYTCDKCGDTYTEERETAKHTFDGSGDLECDECGIVFIEYAFKASDYKTKTGISVYTGDVVIPETFQAKDGKYYKTTSIDELAFFQNGITSVVIPDSVQAIGQSAFNGCTKLTKVKIPEGVTVINDYVFSECAFASVGITGSGADLELPNTITSIGKYAFDETALLNDVVLPESISVIAQRAFDKSALKSIKIPDNVETIERYTFAECSNLTSVIFGDNSKLKTICGEAFGDCIALESIRIPDSVETIGWVSGNSMSGAFENCSALKNVEFGKNSRLTTLEESAFWNCKSLETIALPKSLKTIGKEAFEDCTNLKHVYFEEGSQLKTICTRAFMDCESLESIIIPDGVTEINYIVFGNCKKLSSVIIPNDVTFIDTYAFYFCTSLKELTVPKTVTQINKSAFWQVNGDTLYFTGTKAEWYKVEKTDWNYGGGFKKVMCSDGEACFTCMAGSGTCQETATCVKCGEPYNLRGVHVPDENGICTLCGAKATVIESQHYPYTDINSNIVGRWDYSDAKSVNIIVTYQTSTPESSGSPSQYFTIGNGTNYLKREGGFTTYPFSAGYFFGTTGKTLVFENVEMLTGEVRFTVTGGQSKNYYGYQIEITPNY